MAKHLQDLVQNAVATVRQDFATRPLPPRLVGLDTFAGEKQMASSFQDAGMAMTTYEKNDDDVLEDCLADRGRQNFVQKLVQVSLRSGGLCWLGPPCSCWIWVSRPNHKRSKVRPEGVVAGNPCGDKVRVDNAIAKFVADAILACAALNVYFVLEQPQSSVFVNYPAVQEALSKVEAVRVHLELWKFQSDTPKPLQLWGTAPWLVQLDELANKRISEAPTLRQSAGRISFPKPMANLTVCGPRGQITGDKEKMKKSAGYPKCFCDVVAHFHKKMLEKAREPVLALALIFWRSDPFFKGVKFQRALIAFLLPHHRMF